MQKYTYWGGINPPPDHLLTKNQLSDLGFKHLPDPVGYIIHSYDTGRNYITIYLYEICQEYQIKIKLLFGLDYPYVVQIDDRVWQDLLKNPDLWKLFNQHMDRHLVKVRDELNLTLFSENQAMYQLDHDYL
jgi:hypothetical protein